LDSTVNYAIQLGGGDTFKTYSDSSFADNTLDRKSSHGFLSILYGGVVAWKAAKQTTFTTLTTEAELLALAFAAKEAIYILRLLQSLGAKWGTKEVIIHCDNKQTVRLVISLVPTL
jgi:hypothetical protein